MSSISDYIGGDVKVWVSGNQYKRGQIVLSPADNYQPWVRIAADGGGTTDPSADSANYRPFGARPIKSIQRGIIAFNTQQTQVDQAITAVNTSKSELRFLGFKVSGGSNPDIAQAVMIQLLNSTTVRANRGASGTSAEVSWELTEFY